jgi:hypothetical protein
VAGQHALGRLAAETCLNAIAGKVAVTAGQIDLGYETIAREYEQKQLNAKLGQLIAGHPLKHNSYDPSAHGSIGSVKRGAMGSSVVAKG